MSIMISVISINKMFLCVVQMLHTYLCTSCNIYKFLKAGHNFSMTQCMSYLTEMLRLNEILLTDHRGNEASGLSLLRHHLNILLIIVIFHLLLMRIN